MVAGIGHVAEEAESQSHATFDLTAKVINFGLATKTVLRWELMDAVIGRV